MSEKDKHNLLSLMKKISEDGYKTNWMGGLEHVLWKAVLEGPRHYGQTEIDEKTIGELEKLSRKCQGWWTKDKNSVDISFVDLKEWRSLYSPEISAFSLSEVMCDIDGNEFQTNNIYIIYSGQRPVISESSETKNKYKEYNKFVLVSSELQPDHPMLVILKMKDVRLDHGIVVFKSKKIFQDLAAVDALEEHGLSILSLQ